MPRGLLGCLNKQKKTAAEKSRFAPSYILGASSVIYSSWFRSKYAHHSVGSLKRAVEVVSFRG